MLRAVLLAASFFAAAQGDAITALEKEIEQEEAVAALVEKEIAKDKALLEKLTTPPPSPPPTKASEPVPYWSPTLATIGKGYCKVDDPAIEITTHCESLDACYRRCSAARFCSVTHQCKACKGFAFTSQDKMNFCGHAKGANASRCKLYVGESKIPITSTTLYPQNNDDYECHFVDEWV